MLLEGKKRAADRPPKPVSVPPQSLEAARAAALALRLAPRTAHARPTCRSPRKPGIWRRGLGGPEGETHCLHAHRRHRNKTTAGRRTMTSANSAVRPQRLPRRRPGCGRARHSEAGKRQHTRARWPLRSRRDP
ncbi:hypothetical protein TRVL_08338 [Trypanosoma vivax]|nr:hypothetical protein TRVL_08338 [Trypanosoma vivax]